jgi:hypothetical protein
MERRCYGREYSGRGYRVRLRTARESHPCWYCPNKILPGQLYVEVRRPDKVVERYHTDCFNLQYRHTGLRLVVVDALHGAVLCQA